MSNLTGKTALVTGGTGGIGNAICTRLSDAGCKVITTYRNREKAEQWQQEHAGAGRDFSIISCDVGDYASCQSMAGQILADHGQVDILVNNAGLTRDKVFLKMTPGMWSDVIKADLDSIFNVTHQFVPAMVERGFGRIINISSINGQKGQFGQANYAASKAGIHGFTMSLAQEGARKGVTANTVSPGYIESPMVNAVPEDIRNQIIAQIPRNRLGRPADIARTVVFLAADDADFITGANIPVNGGHYMS